MGKKYQAALGLSAELTRSTLFAYGLSSGRAKIIAGNFAGNVQTKFCP